MQQFIPDQYTLQSLANQGYFTKPIDEVDLNLLRSALEWTVPDLINNYINWLRQTKEYRVSDYPDINNLIVEIVLPRVYQLFAQIWQGGAFRGFSKYYYLPGFSYLIWGTVEKQEGVMDRLIELPQVVGRVDQAIVVDYFDDLDHMFKYLVNRGGYKYFDAEVEVKDLDYLSDKQMNDLASFIEAAVIDDGNDLSFLDTVDNSLKTGFVGIVGGDGYFPKILPPNYYVTVISHLLVVISSNQPHKPTFYTDQDQPTVPTLLARFALVENLDQKRESAYISDEGI